MGFRRLGPGGEHRAAPFRSVLGREVSRTVCSASSVMALRGCRSVRRTVHRGLFPAIVAVVGHPHRRPGRPVPRSRVSRAVPVGGPDAPAARRGRPRDPSPGSRPSPRHIPGASGSTAPDTLWIVDLAGGPERPVFLFRQAPMAASPSRHSAFPDRPAPLQPFMSASVAKTVTVSVRATVCLAPALSASPGCPPVRHGASASSRGRAAPGRDPPAAPHPAAGGRGAREQAAGVAGAAGHPLRLSVRVGAAAVGAAEAPGGARAVPARGPVHGAAVQFRIPEDPGPGTPWPWTDSRSRESRWVIPAGKTGAGPDSAPGSARPENRVLSALGPEPPLRLPAGPAVARPAPGRAALPADQRRPPPAPGRHTAQAPGGETPETRAVVPVHRRVPKAPLCGPREPDLHIGEPQVTGRRPADRVGVHTCPHSFVHAPLWRIPCGTASEKSRRQRKKSRITGKIFCQAKSTENGVGCRCLPTGETPEGTA